MPSGSSSSLLVQSWGEGAGLAHAGPLSPSIFIVGDRKQSIYGFRDADVSVLGDAMRFLAGLRPDGDVRRSISRSFRSVASLLSFVNDVCHDMDKVTRSGRRVRIRRGRSISHRRDSAPLPVDRGSNGAVQDDPALGLVLGDTAESCAEATAAEIARLIESGTVVRDSSTGLRRPVRAGDVAILFRTRESHRAFEDALQRRGVASYVYKGLGFFDTDEIRDMVALLGFLAQPDSHLRAAALLRSGVVRLSDAGLCSAWRRTWPVRFAIPASRCHRAARSHRCPCTRLRESGVSAVADARRSDTAGGTVRSRDQRIGVCRRDREARARARRERT